jgi:hypothetical protein
MTTLQLRRATKRRLRNLPLAKLKVAVEFLTYLATSASDEATAELLRISRFRKDARKTYRENAAGKGVTWRKVLRQGT